ncbi:MAG: lipoyl domain-containing protein [Planctomycetaceae bacterium]|nr:lipoyl domain-containing protein [Planctomycetaceae bacterium]
MSSARDAPTVPIVVPDLGAKDQPIRFAQWLVKSGDDVLEQDRVVEVLVSGVLFYVAAPAEGTVHHTIESPGAPLHPGDILGTIRVTSG